MGRLGRQPQQHADPHDRPDRRDDGSASRPGPGTTSRRTTTTSTPRSRPTAARPGHAGRRPRSTATAATVGPEVLGPVSAYKGQKRPVPVPLRHRRRPALRGPVPRRHRHHHRRHRGLTDDVEAGTNGWTAAGFTRMGGSTSRAGARTTTSPRTASTPATTTTLQDRPVQLRLGEHPAGLGGAVPVPERPAGLVRRRRVRRQQHLASTPVAARCCRSTPARRRSSSPDGVAARQPAPAVRRHLRPGEDRRGDLPPQRRPRHGARRSRRSRRSTTPNPNRYWTADNPWASVQVAGSGTNITVAQDQQPGAGHAAEGPLHQVVTHCTHDRRGPGTFPGPRSRARGRQGVGGP